MGASRSGSRGNAALWPLPAFACLYLAVTLAWGVSWWVAAFYAGISLLTFTVYAWDKAAARAGRWRTAESTLHLLALAGGWPGALLAQQWLRHKSVKLACRALFWATVLLNVALWLWLSSLWGRAALTI